MSNSSKNKSNKGTDNDLLSLKKVLAKVLAIDIDDIKLSTDESCKNVNKLLETIALQLDKKNDTLIHLEHIARIGNWEHIINSNVIKCSKESFKIFGVDELYDRGDEVTVSDFFNLINKNDAAIVNQILSSAIENSRDFKLSHRLKDDESKFIEIRGSFEVDDDDNAIRIFGTVQDVTELTVTKDNLILENQELETKFSQRTRDLQRAYRNLEEDMARREQAMIKDRYISSIVENSALAIISISTKGFVKSWNKASSKMYGYHEDEITDQHITKLIPEEKLEEFEQIMDTVLDGKKIDILETKRLRKDGKIIDVILNISPVKNHLNEVVDISIIARDVTELKSLKLNEKINRTLYDTMNEGVLMVNDENTITFANDFMCSMLGYSSVELINKNVLELLDKNYDKRQIDNITESRRKGKSSKQEFQMITKKGDKIWVLASISPTYDEYGKINGSIGLHTNITDRKEMEQELNAIADISEENPNPVFRYSVADKTLLYSNSASKKTQNFFDDDKHQILKKQWVKEINEIYKNGALEKRELKVGEKTYMCTIVPIPEKEYVNMYVLDITAVKKAEEEIRRLSFVLSKTENSVIITNSNGVIQWVNEGFEKLTGYSADEVIKTNGEILRKGRKTGINSNSPYYRKLVSSKQSLSYESKNYKKSGEVFWTITTLTPILNEVDKVESIIAIDTDITEKKKAEQEMLRAKQLAEESARAKELFLANMSHEIRTPMNAIMGIVQLLRNTKINPEQVEYLNSMNFASNHLLRIINDILDLSKIESGKMSLEKIPFSLNEVINNLFNSIGYKASEKNIELIKKIHLDIPEIIVGDPVRLNQILINLISNSIKFTEKGHIKLEISLDKLTKNNASIVFEISDTGIGISEDKQDKIFSEFEQANKETTRLYGGTGLGLSIVKRLIELQHGSIKLESKEGEGTKISFTISFALNEKRPKQEIQTELKSNNLNLEHTKILLVEDNKLNQMVASKFLEEINGKVTIANNGQECVDILDHEHYDLVLMDIQMPQMDGYTATKYIRTKLKGESKKVPILAMTAHAIGGEKEKCINVGMNDYITKPLDRAALKQKIYNLLNPKS